MLTIQWNPSAVEINLSAIRVKSQKAADLFYLGIIHYLDVLIPCNVLPPQIRAEI